MSDRLVELQGRIQRTRTALASLADRAAEVRTRFAADAELRASLDRLVHEAARSGQGAPPTPDEVGEDGHFVSDAWEIALINEEGK